MKTVLTLIFYMVLSNTAQADNKNIQPYIPLDVYNVDVHRVREQIIKVIVSYPDGTPKITLERISTPNLKLLESREIDSIKLNTGKQLDLVNMSALSVNDITITTNIISIPFEYFPLTGSGILADCKIAVNESTFSAMTCVSKPLTLN